jgi:DNA-binding response OmpR family regulator
MSGSIAHRTVRRRGSLVPLTPAEFAILEFWRRARARRHAPDLAERAFGHDYDALDQTIMRTS